MSASTLLSTYAIKIFFILSMIYLIDIINFNIHERGLQVYYHGCVAAPKLVSGYPVKDLILPME